MDTASSTYALLLAKGVETCRCPRQYVGTSCQDPAPGFYRKRKPNYLNSKDVLDLVGWAEPCNCNNHTNICDKETGVCINCGGNTMGDHCDQCIKGYYGDPTRGPCRPCACPHPTNSFSDTCVPDALDYICINCQAGYTGRHCERCESGYYGDLSREDGRCLACNCNPYGSKSRECDARTGQCHCNEGVSGRDCTTCSHGFILTEYGCKSCEDECTGILLRELYEMQLKLDKTNFTDLPRLPWGYLNKILGEKQRLKPLVEQYQRNVTMGKDLVDKFTFYLDLEAQADLLLVKAKEFIPRAQNNAVDAKDTLDEAQKLLDDLNKIWQSIRELVAELNRHGTDPGGPGISVERTLQEAERILREIKARNFHPDKENAERELRKAQNLLNNVKKLTLDRAHVDDLKQKIDNLDKLLSDLIKKVNEGVRKPLDKAQEVYNAGRARQKLVEGIIADINAVLDNSNKTLKEANKLLDLANSALIDAAVEFEHLPRLQRELRNATDQLDEHRSKLAYLNPLYKEKYVIPAQEHADELERQSQHLANLFSATKELSDIPLQAAKAYQKIIDAIIAAENAAKEAEIAADIAYRQAYPEIGDALTEQAERARARSLELLAEAQKLNEEKVPELEQKMRKQKKGLENLSDDLALGKRSNDIINRELDALPKGVGDSLEDAARKGKIAQEKANGANKRVDDLMDRINKELQPKFDSIRAGTVGGLDNLTKIIQQARDDTRSASRLADSADASAKRVRKQNEITKLNLKELKDKILLARQKASSIRVGLTNDRNGECVRSFVPQVEPSTTSNIILNYATKSDDQDSLLFYIGSSKQEDFMAIEMVNRKIRFLWNSGGETQIITHNMTIETNNQQLLKNDQWFKIEANRIGNLATLSVKRTPDGQKPDLHEVSGASPAGYTKMDLDHTSNFFIGGFFEEQVPPLELRTSHFSGCLYEVTLDGNPVGLWNFARNKGCDGCKEGATEDIDISAFEFQGGDSYAIVPQIPYYRKSDLYTVLSFKTLNEEALLFLSCNFQTGHYISLELKGGRVVYQVNLGDGAPMMLKTAKKYNTGMWIRVEASRERFEVQLLVQEEFLEDQKPGGKSSSVDLADSPLYYGGVPPNFTQERWPGITFTNFFGCMRDLQMDSTPIDLSRGSFYGTRVGCSERPLKRASFNGMGYLELDGQPLTSDSSISFSFMTHQNDALLMLSTYAGQADADAEQLETYYSLALKDGRIEANFNGGAGDTLLTSDRVITAGQFHTVNILRKNRRLVLRIDDEEEGEIRLSRGARDITSPTKGGLFFGGVKESIIVGKMSSSQQPFIGIIQDAIFNNKLLHFENAVDHKAVDFGMPDVETLAEEIFQQMAPSLPPESCTANLDFDYDSFSLQSSEPSDIFFNKKEMQIKFNISFEFRTYYPEGNLISLINTHKRSYLVLYLEKGLVKAAFVRRGDHRNAKYYKQLSIEKWHLVEIVKHGRALTIHIDKEPSMILEVPKKIAFKKMSIGGNIDFINSLEQGIFNFKGCIKNIHVNGLPKTITSGTPCFKNVEFGQYFIGMGYITQDTEFPLGKEIHVSMRIRSSNFDGSLLNIHSRSTNLWFELCLQDNAVYATLYDKENLKIQLYHYVTSNDNSCNYNWHNIEVSYKNGKFILIIDDMKTVQEAKHLPEQLGFSQVYIGGKPDKLSHFGQCKNNFIGCVRKLTLNGESLQIRSTQKEQNFIQHSCPKL